MSTLAWWKSWSRKALCDSGSKFDGTRDSVFGGIVVVQDWFQNFSFIVTFITHTMSTLLHQFPFNYSCVFSGNTLQKTT